MWMICWSGFHGDGWDRFDSREETIRLANTLVREENIEPCDILIFPPEAEGLATGFDVLKD